VSAHLDVAAVDRLLTGGAPPGQPAVPPAGVFPGAPARA
jgi:hypothetical protein